MRERREVESIEVGILSAVRTASLWEGKMQNLFNVAKAHAREEATNNDGSRGNG